MKDKMIKDYSFMEPETIKEKIEVFILKRRFPDIYNICDDYSFSKPLKGSKPIWKPRVNK